MTDTQEIPEDVRELAQKIAPCFGLRAADRYCRHTADDACEDNCEWAASIQRAIMADRAARSAQPGVVVKPLQWSKVDPRSQGGSAETVAGRYHVWTHPEARGQWFWRFLPYGPAGRSGVENVVADEAAGKSAAEAHNVSTILSAILDAPDHSALLRKAMTALADAGTQLTQAGNVAYNMKQTTSTVESAREFARISAWVDGAKETIRGAIQSLKTAIGDANG